MKRRQFLKASAVVGTSAVTAGMSLPGVAAADANRNTAFVLVHGSWHGGWCWDLVSQHLNADGYATVSIDLPCHGLNTVLPSSFAARPLDAAAFATEPSAIASIGIDAFADAVIEGADRAIAAGADKVIVVGHSMGGVPITFAAAKAPEKFAGLVYLAALAPTPGKPAGAYLASEDQSTNSKMGAAFLADPGKIGALRIDPRSTDPAYQAKLKAALAGDVDDQLLATVMHHLTPDAPAAMYGEVAEFPDAFGALDRTYIRCTQDSAVMSSTSAAIVDDMNAAWPDQKTSLVDLESSHAAMFSKPKELAQLLVAAI